MFFHLTPLSETRTLFLRLVSLCYAMAFLSIYPQIEGLYGPRGLLPASHTLKSLPGLSSDVGWSNIQEWLRHWHPNLLKILPSYLGIRVDLTMELLCLLGATLAMAMTIKRSFNHKLNFVLLWLFYISIYSVGQTFLWFQWDILLLETGFLCIIVAPFPLERHEQTKPWDELKMFLVRWLLFRMMFSSGVVKLLSRCPAWWGLTAMPVHYESQCLPTWLAWYAYQLPSTVHKLSVIVTYIVEIPLTLWFFAPTKSLKAFTFLGQLILMFSIMATGNYNFFNLLYIALCISLMDDNWLTKNPGNGRRTTTVTKILSYIFDAIMFGGLAYCFYHFFVGLKAGELQLDINFTLEDFQRFVEFVGKESFHLAMVIFTLKGLIAVYNSLILPSNFIKKVTALLSTLSYLGIGFLMISISVPQYLRGMSVSSMPQALPAWAPSLAKDLNHLDLVNSYGLFRSMTGIGGRPEVILEGAQSASGPWKEYHFQYKPGGRLDDPPKFLLPHQPRLDWQMWFAALGSYQHNPWLLSLIYRLLQNESTVLNLIDQSANPFPNSPPKVIRAKLYKYHFTNDYEGADYWYREFDRDYIPAVSTEDLKQVMIQIGTIDKSGNDLKDQSSNKDLEKYLSLLRKFWQDFPHHVPVQSLLWLLIPILLF